MIVGCGKCDSCLVEKSNRWVQRLECEIKSWKYCVFFTLTYNNEHVPTAIIENGFVKDCSCVHTAPGEPLCFSIDSLHLSEKEKDYINSQKTLQYLSHYDLQCFMKRVRENLRNNFKRNNQNVEESFLRFYASGEYGPTNYRPHYHGLLFFNSFFTSSCIEQIIHQAWPFGFVDTSFASSDAARYVARYVNCSSHLPSIYQYRQIRPFAHFSKCPPIGSMFLSSDTIQEIFNACTPTFVLANVIKRQYVNVPLWRFVEDRLFPKCPRFSRISHFDRIKLYRITQCEDFADVEEFVTWCKSDGVNKSDSLHQLLKDISSNYRFDSTLRNLYYISSHVWANAQRFGLDVSTYVERIENYYNNKDYENLLKFYRFQAQYVDANKPLSDLVNLDCNFLASIFETGDINKIDRSSDSFSNMCYQLEGYGIDVDRFFGDDLTERQKYYDSLSLFNCSDYKDLSVNRHKILKDTTKTKQKNDYLHNCGLISKADIYEQFISRPET